MDEILKSTKGVLLNGSKEKLISNFKIDSREIKKDDFYIPLIGEKVDGHKFIIDTVKNGCSGFFLGNNENINLDEIIKLNNDVVIIQVEDTLKALYNIGLYNREKHIDLEVISITGSVGKTSTREMIASVLSQKFDFLVTQKNLNGHIGLPLMSLKIDNQKLAIFEAGIDFIGEMDLLGNILKPDIAVITNIGTSHIGKLGSKEIIYNEKSKIANYLRGKKILLLNRDDEYLKKYKNDNLNIIYYGIEDAHNISYNQDSITFDINIYDKEEHITINAIGNHNILNAIVAIKIAQIYDMSSKDIIEGIKKYRNFPRRMEKIELNNVIIIDDTYNASPNSTASGIKTVDGFESNRKIAVLADILELGKFSTKIHKELGEIFKDTNYDILIVFGNAMKDLAKTAKKYVKEIYSFDNCNQAEEKIREIMQDGDLIYFKGSNAMNVNKIIDSLKKDFMN